MALLALLASIFIYTEITKYTSSEILEGNEGKLLRTSSFLTEIYKSENLSKLVQQHYGRKSLKNYTRKIDSLLLEIDTLKVNSQNTVQKQLLDSVRLLLRQKVANVSELRSLRQKNDKSGSIDSLLQKFNKIALSVGQITPESFVSNFDELPKRSQEVLKDYVSYLNKNIPNQSKPGSNAKKIDSILSASKAILSEAKIQSEKTKYDLSKKERELYQADIELSQKLQRIISAIDNEITANTLKSKKQKKEALTKSIYLAGFTALIGLLVVILFTFLIHKDFWKIESYKMKLEAEKKFSESVLKSRERLIATVGHDLKTPLTTILGYSGLMATTTLNGTQRTYVNTIKSASTYVEALVNDLLDFSEIEAGKITLDRKPFRIDKLIREITEHLGKIHNKDEVVVHLDISKKLHKTIIGNPLRVRQILNNLIGNALKFTEKGSVTVKATVTEENQICVSIIDTGIGIAKERQELIFNEFSQAEETIGKKYGGHGLGLTISKKLSELLKGRIALQSKLGEGSTFQLYLPLVFATEFIHIASENTIDPTTISLLIIDDDPSLLGLLKELCKTEGIVPHTFSDFEEIKKNQALDYHAVLTDIQMPLTDGFEVLKKLQSGDYRHYKRQPILAMTGQTNIDENEYLLKGFADVLKKPFSKALFLEKIQACITANGGVKKNADSPKPRSLATEQPIFCLKGLVSFLDNDYGVLNEIIATFLADTKKNMEKLSDAVSTENIEQVNEIAHRMLPMFRQLKASNAVYDLEKLETIQKKQSKKIQEVFNSLKNYVTELDNALTKQIFTNRDCNG